MTKLKQIIYKEITAPTLIAVIVLSFVVFTREFGRLAETLIRKSASAGIVMEVTLSLLPSILAFTLPIGFLIGVLIGFSRLSSDNEITALRANGVGLSRLLTPVLIVGLAVTLVTAAFTLVLLPLGNWNLRQIRHRVGLRPVQSAIRPRVFNEDLPGRILYVEDIDLRSSSWRGIFLADTAGTGEQKLVLSRGGRVVIPPDGRRLQLHFENGAVYTVSRSAPEKDSIGRFGTWDVPIQFPEVEFKVKAKRPEDKTMAELWRDMRHVSGAERRKSSVEFQSRLALPLASLVFCVLGVTLGISTHRGGRGYGFVLSLAIAFTYYLLFATGTQLSAQGLLPNLIGVWGANLLLAAVGFWSLRHANHPSGVVRVITSWELLLAALEQGRHAAARTQAFLRRIRSRLRSRLENGKPMQVRVARVIDFYLIRSFLFYFLLTLAICISLFYLFTFLELIDDIFAHRTGYGILVQYFIFLLPHILMLLVPISVLIATLVTFGILEKTNQVVAFKSCGISLYRLTAPVLVLALAVCSFLYVIQDHVLPYANQRQDQFRNVIKRRPVQTHYQAGQKWIFGEGNRLYSYSYFDPDRRVFADLSIYNLDIQSSRLLQHIYAPRAVWDSKARGWKLMTGWARDYQDEARPFTRFEEQHFFTSEFPDYFETEVKGSSQMNYAELYGYIQQLQQGGFEVDQLKTELYKKIAFPLVNFVMVILGIPFAFTMGKKGALQGVAIGVLIGIFYWGAFGVFEVLGGNGLLSPLLAAWGPNILFGASGLFLLLSTRT